MPAPWAILAYDLGQYRARCGSQALCSLFPLCGCWRPGPADSKAGPELGTHRHRSSAPGGCHGPPFFHFSNCSLATFSEGGGPRSGSADSGSDPACGLVQLYVLRLPTQARPRGISPSPSAGIRFPQVASATRPGRLPAQKLQASAA